MNNSTPIVSPPSPHRLLRRKIGRLFAAALGVALVILVPAARADIVVLDDDFNDPNNNLGINTNGIGHGFTSFMAGGNTNAFAGETNDSAVLSSSLNGASRNVFDSIDAVPINGGGTRFEFRGVSFANQTNNTGAPNTDRLLLAVQDNGTAGDWIENGMTAAPNGFWIQIMSDSEAVSTGNGSWTGTSALFYKDSSGTRTELASWIFDNLRWTQAGPTNFSPVLNIALTLSGKSWALNITGDTQGGGSPISFSGTYAAAGITPVLMDGFDNSYIGAEDQTEGPGITLAVDRVVATQLGTLVVLTPSFSTPEYGYNTNFVLAGEAVNLISTVIDTTGTPTLQWQIADSSAPGTFTNLPGATTTNLSVDTSVLGDSIARGFQLIATDGGNSVTSPVVTLTVGPGSAPVLVTDITPVGPTNIASLGSGFTYSAAFSGNLPMTNQWQKSPDSVTWTNIPNATNATLEFGAVGYGNDGFYRLVVTNLYGYTNTSTNYLFVTNTNPKFVWAGTVPYSGLIAEQMLTNFPGTAIAGALVAQNGGNPIRVILTNANMEPIVFAPANISWASVSGGNGFFVGANTNQTGNNDFNRCLNRAYNDGATHTLSLSGLIVGQQYQVQLFALDDRSGLNPAANTRTVNWQDPADPNDVSLTYSMADNVYLVGTFYASNTVETIQENLLVNSGNFNCLVLRAVGWTPPPYFVLEPQNNGNIAGGNTTLAGLAAGDSTIVNPTIIYQWAAGPAGGPYTNLVESTKYQGTTTTNLTITSLNANDALPAYVLIASNGGGSTTSSVASVTVGTVPGPGTYGAAILNDSPIAFWQLNETNNPAAGALALDYTGNLHNAPYGVGSLNGFNSVLSPQPPTYPGFAANQGALQTTANQGNSVAISPPLNLNTNTVTIAMWINPSGQPAANTGLYFNRNGGDAAGFGFGGGQSGGLTELGYTWNNNSGATWGYNSRLYPPLNAWSFVALVIQSNQATIYLDYIDPITSKTNLLSAVNPIAHTAEAFSGGTTWIGGDPANVNRIFNGSISDVAVYNASLSSAQILQLFGAGLGVIGFAPEISLPASATIRPGQSVQFNAVVGGTAPFTGYQWQFNGVDLTDGLNNGATISGSSTSSLTIANATINNAGTYQLFVTNSIGVGSNGVILNVVPFSDTSLVGHWLPGGQTFADVSGYSPTNTHDGWLVNVGSYWTNDVPPNAVAGGYSLFVITNGLAISNSSTLDTGYTNTFDDTLTNSFSLTFWAKGIPSGTWNPWVSKYGESGQGWQFRTGNPGNTPCWTVRDNGAGSYTIGGGPVWAPTGDLDDLHANVTVDGNWHFYAGTFDTVTGLRNLYVDGNLVGQEIGNVPYTLAAASHVVIGARDNGGNSFGNYFTGSLYDVRIYDYAVNQSQIRTIGRLTPPSPVTQRINGNELVLSWSWGTLYAGTNLLGPWAPVGGATSPYTNSTTTMPQRFFFISNP